MKFDKALDEYRMTFSELKKIQAKEEEQRQRVSESLSPLRQIIRADFLQLINKINRKLHLEQRIDRPYFNFEGHYNPLRVNIDIEKIGGVAYGNRKDISIEFMPIPEIFVEPFKLFSEKYKKYGIPVDIRIPNAWYDRDCEK